MDEGDFSLKENVSENDLSRQEFEKWPSGKEPEAQSRLPGGAELLLGPESPTRRRL